MSVKLSPLALGSALVLAACGGGGTPVGPDTFELQGTAATGMPYPDGSEVTVTDAQGTLARGTVAGGQGSYVVPVSTSAKAPFVVKVRAEDLPSLVSVSTDAQPARVNVTPITNLIAATLSPSGNPEKLADEIKADASSVTAEKLASSKKEVVDSILKPVTDALGDSSDPITGNFEIGKGHDLVLEALKIQVQPTGSNTSMVSVSLRSTTAVDMPVIALGAGGSTSLPKLADAVGSAGLDKNDLATDGLPVQIAGLLSRMTACYALPVAERIKSGRTDAADIQAEGCKSLFLGSDPAKFLHNSYRVSSTGAFKGIFSSSPAAQSLKFSLPSFEYKVKNGNTTDATKPMDGDVVFTARWQDSEGNSGIDEHWARPDASGKLFLTGNLSGLDIEVTPRAELREFPNRSGKDFYNTGYNLFVNAKHVFAKVIVTSPTGKTITLVRAGGLDFFTIAKTGTSPSNTSVLRLAGSYKDSTQTGTPRTDFASLIWAGDQDTSDAEIAAMGAQGTWIFDLYTAANDTTPAVTGVKRRTLQRAPTLAELKAATWPSLTEQMRADLKVDTGTKGYVTTEGEAGAIKIAAGSNDDQPAWTVPTGAWSPTRATLFGMDPTTAQAFNDAAAFPSNARKTDIRCATSGTSDKHCADSAGSFVKGLQLNQLQLTGRDSRRVQMNYAVDFRIK